MARQKRFYLSNEKTSQQSPADRPSRDRPSHGWLSRLIGGQSDEGRRGRLQLESLERRQLMAGDVDLFATDGVDPASEISAADVAANSQNTDSQNTNSQNTNSQNTVGAASDAPPPVFPSTTLAEGEAAPDLVAFAELLGQLNVQYFGSDSCAACRQQRDLFDDGGDNLPFIEVTNPDGTLNAVGIANNITVFPTWQFPSGQRLEGVQSLEAIALAAGVEIPISDVPSFEAIGDQTVAIGSPLHVVVDAFDPGGGPVTTTVTIDNPDLVEATVISGNRSIRIDVQDFGVLVFELFEGRSPRTTGQIIQLALDGFYDQQPNGDEITFHRVIDNFVIQAGDPTGTGAGGSTLPDVDDEFHPDLQHNREGVLSFAKAGDDTNNSQFFVTETPTRTLDFNHSVLGQLVEGFDVREAISRVPTLSNGQPVTPVRINSVEVFEDNENSLVLLRPVSGQTGTTTATITTTDADGNVATETIEVNVVEDVGFAANSQPYLEDIVTPAATPNTSAATLQLSSIDIEGDPVRYSAFNRTTGTNIGVSVDEVTGLVTVTPPAGFVGTAQVEVRVEWEVPAFANQFDSQLVEFEFTASSVSESLVFEADQIAFVGNTFTTDVDISGGDQTGVEFTLVNPPANASIDATTGVITVTPEATQAGNLVLAVSASRAGAVIDTGSINLDIREATASYRVELTNIDGSPVTSLQAGDEFFATVILEDQRPFPSNTGVFAAAVDLTFDPDAIRPADSATIEFLQPLDDLNGGTIGDGIIDNIRGVSPTTTGTGQAVNPFARIRFVALAAGTTTLQTASAADAEDTLLLDLDERILPSNIAFGSASVSITSDLVVADDGFTIAEDSPATLFDVLGNDSTAGGNASLAITAVTQPAQGGTVSIVDGQLQFTPVANFVGDATFSYTASVNGNGESASADVTVTVTNVNDPPTAVDDNFSVGLSQTPRELDLLANDTFAPDAGETLVITDVTTPTSGGTVTISADGLNVTYTPPTGSTESSDSFTYTISDGELTATATVTIDLDAVPTAVGDSVTLDEDTTTEIDPLVNDIADVDGQTFTIVSLGTPSGGGTATIIDGGTRISYTPAANFNGVETITYTIRDTGGGESTATITFNVAAVNDPPPAGTFDRSVVRLSDSTLEQTVLRISDLPQNVDGNETVRFESVSIGSDATGTVSVSPEGTELIFVPSADASNTDDVITFVSVDDAGLTSNGTINITVNDFERRTIRVEFENTNSATRAVESSTRLVGTSIEGESISVDAVIAEDGSFSFPSVAPGTYEVVVAANPFLQGREVEQRIAINSGVADGDAVVAANGGLLRPEFISVQDFLGSTSQQSVLVAVAPGADSILTLSSLNQPVANVRGSLDADGNQLTLRGVDGSAADDAEVAATLATNGDARVQSRGQIGNMQLYRINLDDSGSLFTPATDGGDAASTAPVAQPSSAAASTAASTATSAAANPIDALSDDDDNALDNVLNTLSGQNAGIDSSVNDEVISDVFGEI